METQVENSIYEISSPTIQLTGAGGFVAARNIKVWNKSEEDVIVFSQGDQFKLETVKAGGSIGLDFAGGLELGGETERAQRDHASKVSKEVVPKECGKTTINLHGNQTSNLFSVGFVVEGKYQMFVLDKNLVAGSEIKVKAYPPDENHSFVDIEMDGKNSAAENHKYATQFMEDLKIPFNQKRKTAAAKCWRELGEPSCMDDVMQHPGGWDIFYKAMDVPPQKKTKVDKWKKKFYDVNDFFQSIEFPEPGEKVDLANAFLKEKTLSSLVELSEEGPEMVNEFIKTVLGEGKTKQKQKKQAQVFFRKLEPTKKKITPLDDKVETQESAEWAWAPAPLRRMMTTTTVQDNVVEIEFDEVTIMREGETMKLDVGPEINEVLAVAEDGELVGLLFLLNQTACWSGGCDECGKHLGPGPDWYHQKGEVFDLCKEHFSEAEDQDAFVAFTDDATIAHYMENAEDDTIAHGYKQDCPPFVAIDLTDEDSAQGKTQQLKNECEKASVVWRHFDQDEELENYLEKKFPEGI